MGLWCGCPHSETWRAGSFSLFLSWKIPLNLCPTDICNGLSVHSRLYSWLWTGVITLPNPKANGYFPKAESEGPHAVVCSCGGGAHGKHLLRSDSTFPIVCFIPLFLLYITLALSLLFIWAQILLHLQPHHKSSAGECFIPPDSGVTAVRTCWWHSHNSALSWTNPGLREQTPDLELLCFSLMRSQNCFKPRQIYTVWCHLTAPASECKWHKEHVEQMEWDMHVKN